MTHRRLLAIVAVATLILTGFGCGSSTPAAATRPITLKYWRTFDDEDAFS
ncbi:MAG: hypothetical protein AAB692_04845 [Patescibacteria group bacterium]